MDNIAGGFLAIWTNGGSSDPLFIFCLLLFSLSHYLRRFNYWRLIVIEGREKKKKRKPLKDLIHGEVWVVSPQERAEPFSGSITSSDAHEHREDSPGG